MARRTAMSKEPRTESSREGERRMPLKREDYDDKGNRNSSDELTRVSPGVYRNSQGKLVGSRGQSLGNRNNRPGAAIGDALGNMINPGNRMPAGRPGQQMSQQEIDAAMQGANLAESIMQQYPNQIQSGYLPNTQQKPMPGRPQMDPGYYNPNFQGRIQDLAYRYPPGQAPTPEQLRQAFQPVQLQQPNSVSSLLRRGR